MHWQFCLQSKLVLNRIDCFAYKFSLVRHELGFGEFSNRDVWQYRCCEVCFINLNGSVEYFW